FKLRHKPISNQRSIIPRSTPSMEGGTETALTKKEHAAPEWQAAMEALILVAEGGGPTMFARIGIMRALNRHHVPSLTRRERSPIGAGASSRGISREAADRRGLTF
ncbi:hypothetical protein ABIC10_008656, partial [Bradyrhizobium sp. S3.2.12]